VLVGKAQPEDLGLEVRSMRIGRGLLVFVFTLGSALCSFAQQRLTPAEAKAHVGEPATVCGSVADVHYATRTWGEPTFINLDRPYPNQVFTILIWGSDRLKFGIPEQRYPGKQVCVTGPITSFRDAPEIVAHDPSAIELH
jgi:hypothetical protein